jgi:GDP-4-dehydro-6-deoxy-D-mannose reductase
MARASGPKVLLTGATGFVGPYVAAALKLAEPAATVVPTARTAETHPAFGAVAGLDITDLKAVLAVIGDVQPTHVLHLAGISSLVRSAQESTTAWNVNLHGTLNVAHAILQSAPHCVLVSVSSGQVYGSSARSGEPLTERTLLAPQTVYDATKAAGELALGASIAAGLRCVRLRPFNHIGPGQTEDFVVPGFAMQIARIERGLQRPVLKVGNLDAERDFLDVRDVARAYAVTILKANTLDRHAILNIASGVPRSIRSLLDHLLTLSPNAITLEIDPARMRPSETPRMVGDASLARKLLGWSPALPIEQTLADVMAYSRAAISSEDPRRS